MRRSGRRPAPVRRRDDEVDPKDLLRQEAQREADVQELDEQVLCLFRVLLAVYEMNVPVMLGMLCN